MQITQLVASVLRYSSVIKLFRFTLKEDKDIPISHS